MKKLSEEIGMLKSIAWLYGLKLNLARDLKTAVGINGYIQYQLNRELTKLNIR